MIQVILGDITFLQKEFDGETKAIINKIYEVKTLDTIDEAEEYGENMLDIFESYLVPKAYSGSIVPLNENVRKVANKLLIDKI